MCEAQWTNNYGLPPAWQGSGGRPWAEPAAGTPWPCRPAQRARVLCPYQMPLQTFQVSGRCSIENCMNIASARVFVVSVLAPCTRGIVLRVGKLCVCHYCKRCRQVFAAAPAALYISFCSVHTTPCTLAHCIEDMAYKILLYTQLYIARCRSPKHSSAVKVPRSCEQCYNSVLQWHGRREPGLP